MEIFLNLVINWVIKFFFYLIYVSICLQYLSPCFEIFFTLIADKVILFLNLIYKY